LIDGLIVRPLSLLRVGVLGLIWGSNFLWIKVSLQGLSPILMVLVRMSLAALFLITFQLIRKRRLPGGLRLWAHLVIAAALANVAPYLLFAIGEQSVNSSTAGILNATTPIWTVAVALAVRQEKQPNASKVAGLALGFLGTLIIFAPWHLGSQIMSVGGLACLLASISFAMSYVYMARYLAGRRFDPLELSASQMGAAAVLSACAVPFLGWQPPAWQQLDVLIAVTVLGVVGTGVAYVITYRIIADDGATAASIVTYLVPAVAILLGTVVLHEKPTITAIIGTMVVLAGVAISHRHPAQIN